jgi:hypothetical protein
MSGAPQTALNRELLVTVRDLPHLVKQRRAFLHRHLEDELHSTLEIGALNTPTIRPGECQTWFLDWFDTKDLRLKHANNPKVNLDDLV